MKLMFVPLQIVRWSSRGQVVILRNVLLVTSGKYDTSLGLAAGQWAAENTAFNFPPPESGSEHQH